MIRRVFPVEVTRDPGTPAPLNPMILILTKRDDSHTDKVIDVLKERNVAYLRFETADYPESIVAGIRYSSQLDAAFLEVNGERVDLADISIVWNRRPEAPGILQELDSDYREFASNESKHVLRSLWSLLRDKFWINPYEAARTAELKPYQLKIASQAGLEIPRTLITNDRAEVMEFFELCRGNIIYKPFTSHFFLKDQKHFYIYANRVSLQDLTAKGDLIRHAPCIFQEYVPKKSELRVTIIGERLFAAEIDSQKSQRSKDDWRRYDFENVAYRPFQLPSTLENKLREFLRKLGLVFGCIDLILTPDGRFVFLEINPGGQWYWVETLTGMPILQCFADMLVQGPSCIRSSPLQF